jgi:hypothetical protein
MHVRIDGDYSTVISATDISKGMLANTPKMD